MLIRTVLYWSHKIGSYPPDPLSASSWLYYGEELHIKSFVPSLSPPFEYIEWRCMCYVKVIIQNLQQSKKLQWQTRSSDSELPETKLMNYYLRRLWISSLTSVIMLWSTVGLESLRIRLSEYNSSGFAFLNKPWIIKSTLSDCRLLHEVPLLLCSLDVPWI